MKLTIENKIKEGVQKCVTEWNWKIRLDSNRLKQKNKWKRKINYYLATKGNELKEMFLQQLLSSIGEETTNWISSRPIGNEQIKEDLFGSDNQQEVMKQKQWKESRENIYKELLSNYIE